MKDKVNKLTNAYRLIESELDRINDEHDCHMSPCDGCTCHTIGFMKLDLAKIYAFILENYHAQPFDDDCPICAMYQSERIATECPKHKPWYRKLYSRIQRRFDPSYTSGEQIL